MDQDPDFTEVPFLVQKRRYRTFIQYPGCSFMIVLSLGEFFMAHFYLIDSFIETVLIELVRYRYSLGCV